MNVTPDGQRYIAAMTQRVARPFHYRWALPWLFRPRKPAPVATPVGVSLGEVAVANPLEKPLTRWARLTRWSVYALAPLTYWYVGGGWHGLAAAACVAGLSGIWSFNRNFPILVDAPAIACALLTADLVHSGLWPLAIPVVLIGAAIRETTPIFAAAFAWSPLPLIGLVAPLIRHFQHEGPDVLDAENRWILDHPIKASRKYHAQVPRAAWVLPWGAGVLALGHLSPQLAVVLGLSYAQCAIATDTVRLYMWAFPTVLAAAVSGVPTRWLPLLVALHLANPFTTGGA